MATGPRDTKDLVVGTGVDATELQKFNFQDGISFATVVANMSAALAALNSELLNHPLYSSLVHYTDEPEAEYRMGASNGFQDFTEHGLADQERAEVESHMLPLLPKDFGMGWTWKFLKDAKSSQVEADFRNAIDRARDLWRVQILTRCLKRGDDSGSALGLGSSGLSPGFATDAGSTGVDYTPPSHGGSSFTSAHEHYVGIAGGAFTNAVFSDSKDELREHGHEPPYEFIASSSDETTIKGLSDFTKAADSNIRYGNDTSLATLDTTATADGSYYIGTIHDFNVRIVRGVPQYYGFGWKSYGPNSSMNPLRVRLEKGVTVPRIIAMVDPRSNGSGAYPLQNLMLYVELGVGVFDRTAGTARYVNNATWADGTPT